MGQVLLRELLNPVNLGCLQADSGRTELNSQIPCCCLRITCAICGKAPHPTHTHIGIGSGNLNGPISTHSSCIAFGHCLSLVPFSLECCCINCFFPPAIDFEETSQLSWGMSFILAVSASFLVGFLTCHLYLVILLNWDLFFKARLDSGETFLG